MRSLRKEHSCEIKHQNAPYTTLGTVNNQLHSKQSPRNEINIPKDGYNGLWAERYLYYGQKGRTTNHRVLLKTPNRFKMDTKTYICV